MLGGKVMLRRGIILLISFEEHCRLAKLGWRLKQAMPPASVSRSFNKISTYGSSIEAHGLQWRDWINMNEVLRPEILSKGRNYRIIYERVFAGTGQTIIL